MQLNLRFAETLLTVFTSHWQSEGSASKTIQMHYKYTPFAVCPQANFPNFAIFGHYANFLCKLNYVNFVDCHLSYPYLVANGKKSSTFGFFPGCRTTLPLLFFISGKFHPFVQLDNRFRLYPQLYYVHFPPLLFFRLFLQRPKRSFT